MLIGARVAKMDVMIALGTHQPMSEEAINARLEVSAQERSTRYAAVDVYNHAWDDASQLRHIGDIPRSEIRELSGGLFEMDVPVAINRRVFDYDLLLILGPVFPHEVVGFSGGNKYLFPGISGPEILNFFHWLGAVIANPKIIGNAYTPVRAVVDRAAQMVNVPKACLCMVIGKDGLNGLYGGTPEAAWDKASQMSDKLHIEFRERPFQTVLSCAPTVSVRSRRCSVARR
jgi:nickel-dependent lactate racemase